MTLGKCETLLLQVLQSYINENLCVLSRSGLELIASKWAHSLIEFDLAWANVQIPIDNAIKAIAEKGAESPLK